MKKPKLRSESQKFTNQSGKGEWWWYEWNDGIYVVHCPKGGTSVSALMSWRKIEAALERKRNTKGSGKSSQ